MNALGRKWFIGFLAVALFWIIATGISFTINSNVPGPEDQEELDWVASGQNVINRQLCRWFGLCGLSHLNSDRWTWDDVQDDHPAPPLPDASEWWRSGTEDPLSWTDEERSKREVPQYVLDHAPYVHLFSKEQFWPTDIAEHLIHTSAHLNYSKVWNLEEECNLTNLNELNDYEGAHYGRYMYLQSDDNVEERPRRKWLSGEENIPIAPGDGGHDDDDEAPWPGRDDAEQPLNPPDVDEAPVLVPQTTDDKLDYRRKLVPSRDGRCGGNTGFTCTKSGFGKCCSIYGWCGKGEAYCGDACDALAGQCHDPFEPVPRPHIDLRKRTLRPADERPDSSNKVGFSSAPAMLIVVDKGEGIIDAFWFFFYSFNLGQKVFKVRFGNHVGDWEHTLIRFRDGKPDTVFLSEHNFGEAYAWDALEKYIVNPHDHMRKIGSWSNVTAARTAKRPVVYSAVGSHAMYAKPGVHPYVLPWGLLHDQTDRGPLWDPALNFQAFTWDHVNQIARASTLNPKAPVGWFHYAGHWGDKFYPLSDPRQYRLAGQYHYVNGPTGPRFKRLDRVAVCPRADRKCDVRQFVTENGRGKRLQLEAVDAEVEEEGGVPGGNFTDAARS